MELVAVQSDEAGGEILDAQPRATLYHTAPWLRLQERLFGYRLHLLAAEQDGRAVGAFPVFLTWRGLLRVAASPRGLEALRMGPLLPDELLPEFLGAYERWARQNRVGFTSIAFTQEIDVPAAQARGWTCERHLNAVVDLRGGPEAVYDRYESECRRRIRLAGKRHVRILEGDLAPHAERYVAWSTEIFTGPGRAKYAHPGRLHRDAQDPRVDRPHVEHSCRGGGRGGRHVRGGLLRRDLHRRGHDHGFGEEKYSCGNIMNWYAMQWACRKGCKEFDFGGARMPGIRRFKESFGARIVPYTNAKRAHGAVGRAGEGIAGMVRSFRARRRGQPRGEQAMEVANTLLRLLRRWIRPLRCPGGIALGRVWIERGAWDVAVALSARGRYVGLGGRDEVPPGTGMLFIYPRPARREFTMRGCQVPLDIAFISSELRVTEMCTMEVEGEGAARKAYRSEDPAQFMPEVPAGELAAAGVRIGSTARLSDGMPSPEWADHWPPPEV